MLHSSLRSGGNLLQYLNGSPVYPRMHVHEGKWFITWHKALSLHVPGQGSWHLLLMQALFEGQSDDKTHSGLHPSYGLPIYSGRHVHDPAPFCSLHTAFEPQGDGMHGVSGCGKTGSCCCRHSTNGSPMYPDIQIQLGVWLITLHSALTPQLLGHGSLHF